MKILLELFSSIWLSTSLVRYIITTRIYHYVIVCALFSLLIRQCIANDTTFDKRINHNSAEIQKQLNDGISILPTATYATHHITNSLFESSSTVKSQSTNYIKRSARTNSPAFRTLTSTSIDPLQSSKPAFFSEAFDGSSTTYSSNVVVSPSNGKPTYSNNVLVLIQKNIIKISIVRDQFYQFIDMFGIKLQNVTIDFDSIDGESNKVSTTIFLAYFILFIHEFN